MRFAIVLLVFCLSCVHSHIHDCSTPNSTLGKCLPLTSCPTLQALYDHITTENYEYLRRSQCGYADDAPEVCCPLAGTVKPRRFQFENPPERTPIITLGNRFKRPGKELPTPGDCGVQVAENKIFGGTITGIDEFPWMALLEYGTKKAYGHGFACGGALIHSRYVLTAAHCVTGKDERALGGLMTVRLGEHNIEKEIDCEAITPTDCAPPPIDVKVVKKIVHPEYKPDTSDQHHDIALLELENDVEFSDFVRPVCLTKNVMKSLFEKGKYHYICGWGVTENKQNSPIKLMAKIQIAETKSCATTYSSRFRIQLGSNRICAGGTGATDSCRGDSGGPMMVPANYERLGPTWFMTGLVSIGPTPCASKNIPGIYTKVSDYYNWIVNNIK